jgi:hypothetical protein
MQYPDSLADTGFAAFFCLDDTQDPSPCDTPEALRAALNAHPGQALLICLPVLRALAPRVDRPVLQALVGWRLAARGWLAVQRDFRARVVVVEAPADEETQAQLARDMTQVLPGWPALGVLPQGPGPTLEALGGLALVQDQPGRDLAATLQAATTGPSGDLPGFEILLGQLSDQARANAALAQHAEQLEHRAAQLSEAQGMRDVLLDQVDALQLAYRDAISDGSRAAQERGLLDQSYRQQLHELQEQLGAVYASTSWRVTAPMRAVMRRVRRG